MWIERPIRPAKRGCLLDGTLFRSVSAALHIKQRWRVKSRNNEGCSLRAQRNPRAGENLKVVVGAKWLWWSSAPRARLCQRRTKVKQSKVTGELTELLVHESNWRHDHAFIFDIAVIAVLLKGVESQ